MYHYAINYDGSLKKMNITYFYGKLPQSFPNHNSPTHNLS